MGTQPDSGQTLGSKDQSLLTLLICPMMKDFMAQKSSKLTSVGSLQTTMISDIGSTRLTLSLLLRTILGKLFRKNSNAAKSDVRKNLTSLDGDTLPKVCLPRKRHSP